MGIRVVFSPHKCKIVVAGEPPLRPLMRNGMNIRFVLVVTLWIAICGKVTPALAGKPIGPAAIAQVEAIFAEELRQHPIGSITVGIVSGVDLVWTRSYGFADMEARTLATRNTMYRIGSVTNNSRGSCCSSSLRPERCAIMNTEPLIVGAGPTGLSAALFLADRGDTQPRHRQGTRAKHHLPRASD
jgi:hypothetical protein